MLPARALILLSTFEAALGVVLMNTEGPVSREYQTGASSSSRSLRTSSIILIDKGLTRIVSNLPVIVIACKFSVSTSASLRSEEHTSELQSLTNLVCRLLLEKKKKTKGNTLNTT